MFVVSVHKHQLRNTLCVYTVVDDVTTLSHGDFALILHNLLLCHVVKTSVSFFLQFFPV